MIAADLVTGEGDDEQSEHVRDIGDRIEQVDPESRLPVRSGGNQSVVATLPERHRFDKALGELATRYSSGTGGMRIQASSLMSETIPSTSLSSKARTNRSRMSCSTGEFAAGGASSADGSSLASVARAVQHAGHRLLGRLEHGGDLLRGEVEDVA